MSERNGNPGRTEEAGGTNGIFRRLIHFKIEIRLLFALGVLALAAMSMLLLRSAFSTELLESETFAGIKPLDKRTTSIIVVHGIGNHCIGYADTLIASLMKDLASSEIEPIEKSYERYWQSLLNTSKPEQFGFKKTGATYKGDFLDIPRDGHCKKIPLDERVARQKNLPINTDDDWEAAVSAQDKVCEFINKEPKQHGLRVYCHKLTVERVKPPGEEGKSEYITGFVRQFEYDITAQKRIRMYEVVWSPATRWLKQSLSRVERFNSEMSGHVMNKFLKNEIMNAGIADAIAYLSESGILVNFDILQAFCLALANERSSVTEYDFTCDAEQLRKSTPQFAKDNDVHIISHSLGTRVVLDSIGQLSLGVHSPKTDNPADADLITTIGNKFKQIGAVVPAKYLDRSAGGFSALLNQRIPEFARAIKSVYVFTNQVPLLAATVTSPFNETYQVGRGFEEFLDLRAKNPTGRPLQIVSFHDPDDLLSYNLSCWYHLAVLRNSEATINHLEAEARFRAQQKGTDVGDERRALRKKLFNDNCSKRKFSEKSDRALFDEIQKGGTDLLAVKNATVRLKGFRIEALAADPLDVHSNYFRDAQVHRWLANGNP